MRRRFTPWLRGEDRSPQRRGGVGPAPPLRGGGGPPQGRGGRSPAPPLREGVDPPPSRGDSRIQQQSQRRPPEGGRYRVKIGARIFFSMLQSRDFNHSGNFLRRRGCLGF